MKPRDIFVAHKKSRENENKNTQISQDKQQNENAAKLLSELNKPLFRIQSFFPLDLFPDQLIINPVEVTYIYSMFFWTTYETSMLIEEIGDIILTQVPLFASLTIMPNSMIKNDPIRMTLVKRADAEKARDLLQGLITLKKQKIDVADVLSQGKGINEIMDIGKAKP